MVSDGKGARMGVAPESVNFGMEWLSMGETARWRISCSPLRQEGEGYHRGRKGGTEAEKGH